MRFFPLILAFLLLLLPAAAEAAGCAHSLGFGAGIVVRDSSNETDLALGADYECRRGKFWGLGAFVNAIFSDPSSVVVGAPQALLHPLGGDFYVAASPILELRSGGNELGLRLSTRIPLPIGVLTLVPHGAVDFIRGGRRYWIGLGVGF